MRTLSTDNDAAGTTVYETLKEQISEGTLKPGDRLLPIKELQDRFDISYRATVKALDRLEDEGLIVRRQGSGTYVRDASAGANGSATSNKTIQVFATYHRGILPWYQPMQEAAVAELEASGCRFTVTNATREEVLHYADRPEADAVLWLYPSVYFTSEALPVPLVIAGPDAEVIWSADTGHDVVTADSRQGGAIAGTCLRRAGCRRVLIVGSFDIIRPENGLQCAGDCTALRKLGFEAGYGARIPDEDVYRGRRGYTPLSGVECVSDLVLQQRQYDGVFAVSDDTATGLCHALVAHGVIPGRDIKVVGFDGQPIHSEDELQLTSVRIPMAELGREAARRALLRAEHPDALSQRINLACTLRKGETA